MLDDEWRNLVSERFPTRDLNETKVDWDRLKGRLRVGESVTGTVVARAPFGPWIDIGVGFPALMLITEVEGLTPERYKADDWCPIGSTITAVVGIFNEKAFVVRIWQKTPEYA